MMMCIDETLLDRGIKPQALHLWLQMIYHSQEDGTIVLSQKEFMKLTGNKDPETNIAYTKELIEQGLITHIGLTNRKNTYSINNNHYYYKK